MQTTPNFPKLTTLEIKILQELVNNCPDCGYPRGAFITRLHQTGIERPLKYIKGLCQKGLLRYDKPDRRRPDGVFKPLKRAYEVLELV